MKPILVPGATLLALLLIVPIPSNAQPGKPSFDCSKASRWSEVVVCRDAELASLDQQMAMLYRDIKAQRPDQQQETLKADQKSWLRQREACKLKSDQVGCLFDVYKSRITQLTSSGDTYPPTTRSKATEGGVAYSSASVWKPSNGSDYLSDWQTCGSDLKCLIAYLKKSGASQQAIGFVGKINGAGFLNEFQEKGRVDLGAVEYPTRANTNGEHVLLNGTPPYVSTEIFEEPMKVDISHDPHYWGLKKQYPNLNVWEASADFLRMEKSSDGGQSFVFAYYLVDGCHACGIPWNALVAFNFGKDGKFHGTSFLKLVPSK